MRIPHVDVKAQYAPLLGELQERLAAALRLLLGQVDGWNAVRREAAARYVGLGEGYELPVDEPGNVVRSSARDRVAEALRAAGIGHATYYTTPLHLQPVYAGLSYEPGSLPETERAARETIALPLWAGISAAQQEEVAATIRAATETGAACEVA